ncbi:MAG: succinate dehydrogenase assembly factor 2 [Alphaproteobacteria bacterium]
MENLSDRQKKLRWHAWHRGMRELDILIGTAIDKHLEYISDDEMDMLEAFLEVDDADVWHWITEKKPIDPQYDNVIWQWIKDERGDI